MHRAFLSELLEYQCSCTKFCSMLAITALATLSRSWITWYLTSNRIVRDRKVLKLHFNSRSSIASFFGGIVAESHAIGTPMHPSFHTSDVSSRQFDKFDAVVRRIISKSSLNIKCIQYKCDLTSLYDGFGM